MIKNFDQLLETLKQNENKTVVIAAAQSPASLEAAILAKRENLADSIMTGDAEFIKNHIRETAPDLVDAFEIIDCGSDIPLACAKAVELVREGRGDLILKGKGSTATILKAVLDKEKGLRSAKVISDVLAVETPERVVLLTDGGINLYPTVDEKVAIVENAVKVGHSLGNPKPKVALLAAVEVVNPKMPCTLDAALIAKMNQRGQIKNCIVDGPFALDNAINLEAARMKGIESEVAGDADILVVPNIEAGNFMGKAFTYYCNYRVAHVVVGTKAPILIPSRADNAETKMLSMALGILCA